MVNQFPRGKVLCAVPPGSLPLHQDYPYARALSGLASNMYLIRGVAPHAYPSLDRVESKVFRLINPNHY